MSRSLSPRLFAPLILIVVFASLASEGLGKSPLLRLTAPAYDDGVSSPRGENHSLPGARFVSNLVCSQPSSFPSRKALSAMVFQWGQFIDHDITLVHAGGEYFPIPVPSGDLEFDPGSSGLQEIPMTRSIGEGMPLQQMNQITSLIDGSGIYGSESARTNALRLFSGGELRAGNGPDGELLPYNDAEILLENANENFSLDPEDLFIAGDIRCNEQSGLLAMHTLFLREHNRLAREISATNRELDDEMVFQKARRKIIAYLQAITYQEFLPAVLGDGALPPYSGYQPTVDPGISNEFSTAAFRVGHSMLPSTMPRMDADFNEHENGHLSLSEAYFVPSEVADMGITPYLRGLACVPLEASDQMVVDEVRNMLFGPPGAGGLDLAALNIQRGRDHGLGSFNVVRSGLGLSVKDGFGDITSDSAAASSLSAAYNGEIDFVDLWVGGMAEDHLPDTILGETFHFLWVDQFQRLRDGDPNWYENVDPSSHPDHFESEELSEIRATTLAKIIGRNTDWSTAETAAMFVVPAPEVLDFTVDSSSGEIRLQWSSFLNAAYGIEASGDLGSNDPFKEVMRVNGADGMTSVILTDEDAIGNPARFYQLIQR